MMNDLIKRSEALAALNKQQMITKSVMRRVVMQVPAVDAVPIEEYETMRADRDSWKDAFFEFNEIAVKVVRCKDCNQGEIDDPDFPDQYYCHAGCGWNKADFFCAYGERRESK